MHTWKTPLSFITIEQKHMKRKETVVELHKSDHLDHNKVFLCLEHLDIILYFCLDIKFTCCKSSQMSHPVNDGMLYIIRMHLV